MLIVLTGVIRVYGLALINQTVVSLVKKQALGNRRLPEELPRIRLAGLLGFGR